MIIIDSNTIAEALSMTPRGVRKKADRENWPSTAEVTKGGKKNSFEIKNLPEEL